MRQFVVDTQCLIWFLTRDRRLPRPVRRVFDAAKAGNARILAPSICLVECLFLLQRHRIPDVVVKELLMLPEAPSTPMYVVGLDMRVVHAMQAFAPAVVPELSDRVIAATAYALGLPLLTTDASIADSGLVKVIA